MIDGLFDDLRHAFRNLASRPGFTAVAVGAVALGIAALVPTFSLVNAYLLRPLPFDEPERLVHVWESSRVLDSDRVRASWPNLQDWRARAQSLTDLAAFNYTSEDLTSGDFPERISAGRVSANLFDVLGVEPLLGRGFLAGEDRPGENRVVVLSHGLWQGRFGVSRSVLGQTLEINGTPHTIVGVMGPGFVFPLPSTQLWLPWPLDETTSPRDRRYLQVVGRLAPGASLEQAEDELTAIAGRVAILHPDSNEGWGISFEPLREALNFAEEILRVAAVVTLVAGGFVLAIACANVSSLLLARGLRRGRELALRKALGAGRGRIVRVLLAEGLVIGLAGGGVGVLLASWQLGLLRAAMPTDLYRVGEIDIDSTVLLATLGVAILASLAVGVLPALRGAGTDLIATLRGGGSATASRRSLRLQRLLVGGQITLALVLLAGTSLMLRSLAALRTVDTGFDTEHVLALLAVLPEEPYADPEARRIFHREVVAEVGAVAGVEAAATVNHLPLNHEYSRLAFTFPDAPAASLDETPRTLGLVVSPAYFEVLDVALLQGRAFDARDRSETLAVAVVNRAFADRWLGPDPIGRQVVLEGGDAPLQVVGVVANARHVELVEPPAPILYRPVAQVPGRYFRVLARTSGDPLEAAASVRRAIWNVDPDLPLTEIRSLQQVVDDFLLPQRMISAALGGLSGGALLLAAVGIYGLLAFFVAQRSREMSIRMALGAGPGDVLRHVLAGGLRLAAFGIGLGLLGALAVGRLMSSLVFGVSPYDPLTLVAVATGLTLLTLLACWIPARRATRVDPIVAMRGE